MRPYVRIGVDSQHGSGEPVMTVNPFTYYSSTAATMNGSFNADASLRAVHEYGFVYKEGRGIVSIGDAGATKLPVGYSSPGSGNNAFSVLRGGLSVNRVWSYRPYVITAAGVFYSASYYGMWTGVDVEWALVSGGGSGGAGIDRTTGGGGSGGYRTGTYQVTSNNVHTFTVGAGGAVGNNSGSLSRAFGNSNGGGGHGGFNASPGANGASGGGGHHNVASTGGTGITGIGYAGGAGYDSGNVNLMFGAGGGGGAGGAGGNASSSATGSAGDGGPGVANDWTGTTLYIAGGGGGGAQYGPSATAYFSGLGRDGGGNGQRLPESSGTAGAGFNGFVNTGGGGGGNAGVGYNTGQNPTGGAGGSGIVIMRYLEGIPLSVIGPGLQYSTGTAVVGSDTYRWTKFTAGSDIVSWA